MIRSAQSLTLIFLLCFSKLATAQPIAKGKFYVQPDVAYSRSDLKWSIAGNQNGTDPNVLSELEWKQLRGPKFGLGLYYGITNKIVATLEASVIDIASGSVTDTDYGDDDRQSPFYNEVFESNKGTGFDMAATVGYTVFSLPNFSIRPFLGYELSKQRLYLLGREGVAEEESLKSSYKTDWQGAVLGTEFNLTAKKINFGLRISGSLLNYKAKANWNLIEEFQKPVSFRHSSNAFSLHGKLKIAYALSQQFGVSLSFSSIYAKALEGVDEAYYVSRPPVQTQLNEVKSFSYSAGAGISFCF